MLTTRRSRSPISLLAALLVPLAGGAGACSGRPMADPPAPARTAAPAPDPIPAAAPAAPAALAAAAPAAADAARPGRTPLGAAPAAPLPFVIEPALDRRSVLFLSKVSSDRVGWVRRLDAATGELGPPLLLLDEDLAGALSSAGGSTTLLTSRDGELCAAAFLPGETTAASRACGPTRASAMAAVGERVALLELELADAAKRAEAAAQRARRERAAAAKPARKTPAAKRPGKTTGASGKATPKKTTRKGRGDDRGRDGRPKKGARPAARPKRPDPLPEVELRIRWISPADGIAATSSPTGLRFRPPLDGMDLIDAAARPGAIDVLHYAASARKPSTSWLGSAQIAFASLGEDGKLDPGRRAVVVEEDLDFGSVRGHLDPRLVTTSAGSVVVDVTGRNGACQATRVAPSLQRLLAGAWPKAVCAVDPARLADATPPAPAELGALEHIAASGARRAAEQPAYDPGLAAWAGDRAYFQTISGELFSASRADGQPRREPDPFPARRARIAWGAIATDGEGLALAAGQLHRLDARGRIAAAGAPPGLAAAPTQGLAAAPPGLAAAPPQPPAAGAPGAPLGEPERPADRRRAARIGASWWLARTDVARLLPAPLVVPALRGRAHEEGAVLVGGRARGLFLEVLGDRLQLTALDASGALTALGALASPVRAGLDACERRGGGAIVAGVSAKDPGEVVALSIDALGRPGAARATSLPLAEGDLAVRLVALPHGGALLTDLARRHVVWLDDDGAELASQPWPADDTGAFCVDGQPARRVVPAPSPGLFAAIPELAAPGACVTGDAVWTADGSLRWFGSSVSGLDAQAEAGLARPALPELTAGAPAAVRPAAARPAAGPPAEAPALAPPGAPACPADMVAVAGGRFCIDRFEAMLVDGATGAALSPDYPSTPNLLELTLAQWSTGRRRAGDVHARAFPLPLLPGWQRGRATAAAARSRLGVRPSGYTTGLVAESACAAAGKRLCSVDEFVTACRGEDDTLYPYGDTYEEGTCNVFRSAHPAALLHGNASIGHLDPRLNRARAGREPLLRETGASPRCRSRWGSDAVYDLVGNLDEWVDEPDGAFAGGFYSRSTRAGCEALVTAHPRTYLDYSTGVRCCRDGLSPPPPAPAPAPERESPPDATADPAGSAPQLPGPPP
ncbi:SUMF1/EgtB/PvdO family nonheme iron enzyme [Sorangium sp. So ce131]|uniref:SUMF1/EgtB/PvdO family nonheme iron enzyme n=1 Tax=Sorangium sp. So ce131 TaxID=3133282 RepID=UPI003F5D983D